MTAVSSFVHIRTCVKNLSRNSMTPLKQYYEVLQQTEFVLGGE